VSALPACSTPGHRLSTENAPLAKMSKTGHFQAKVQGKYEIVTDDDGQTHKQYQFKNVVFQPGGNPSGYITGGMSHDSFDSGMVSGGINVVLFPVRVTCQDLTGTMEILDSRGKVIHSEPALDPPSQAIACDNPHLIAPLKHYQLTEDVFKRADSVRFVLKGTFQPCPH
jgi:hypothetical protein